MPCHFEWSKIFSIDMNSSFVKIISSMERGLTITRCIQLAWVIWPSQVAESRWLQTSKKQTWRTFERKMMKHGEPCREAGLSFCPLPMDTLGAWSESMVTQVKRMGSALARNRGEDESEVIRHLSQRVAVVLAKLNASMLLNRAPQSTPAYVDGIE